MKREINKLVMDRIGVEKKKEKLLKLMELSDRVLDLIDNQAEDEMTRGDLQGAIEAIILQALNFNDSPLSEFKN